MRYTLLLIYMMLASSTALASGGGGGGSTPYFEIQTPFVVNLADTGSLSFLQVNAQLKVKDEEFKKYLYAHLPAIQHTVMLILSEQTAADIKTVSGKQKLRSRTLKEIQELLITKIGDEAIEDIYFTAFIVQ